jgi:23S rRNA-/tRNA-specific pseudouridylate synthase
MLLVVFNRKLASRTQQQFEQRKVQKEYLAIVHGVPVEDEGVRCSIFNRDRHPTGYYCAGRGLLLGCMLETSMRVIK